ncbi:UNVERIFIED_CONTAM: hypothetical protein FKN15_021986 [Acipenser sinensis]
MASPGTVETNRDEEFLKYRSPLVSRYASKEMAYNFSDRKKFTTWRKLWIYLAKAEKSYQCVCEALVQSCQCVCDALVQSYQCVCEALVQSCQCVCDALVQSYQCVCEALVQSCQCVCEALVQSCQCVCEALVQSCQCVCKALVQSCQCVCKALVQSLCMDMRNLQRARAELRFRGVKGTTGTQASFLQLFEGNHDKVEELDRLVTEMAGFKQAYLVTGQTYSRKVDIDSLSVLSSLGATVHKVSDPDSFMFTFMDSLSALSSSDPDSFMFTFMDSLSALSSSDPDGFMFTFKHQRAHSLQGGICTDIRLLANLKELEEPFEKDQIGEGIIQD